MTDTKPEVSVRIADVNGIADLVINLDQPGVYVARGPNGSGKTSAINAMRAVCGDTRAIAEPTDGLQRGSVQLVSEGITLQIGKQRRANGTPTIQLAQTGALGRLIDPGLVDEDKAAKARIRALLELVPLPADEQAVRELCDNDAAIAAGLTRADYPDAMFLADGVRQRAHAMARAEEEKAQKAQGELESIGKLLTDLGTVPEEAPTEEAALSAWNDAIRGADRLQAAAEARADLERRQAEIRATLGERPDVMRFEALTAAAFQEREKAAEALNKAEREYQLAKQKHYAAELDAKRWDEAAGVLAKPVEGPTLDEAAKAKAASDEAAAAVAAARQLAKATEYRRICEHARTVLVTSTERAVTLRRIAARTGYALGRLLDRSGLPGIVVNEERLAVAAENGEVLDFATRLSFGQKVRLALQVALHACRRRGNAPVILPLEPEFWLALDSTRRAEVIAAAVEYGVMLVTEEPADGELRIERLTNTNQ